MQSSLNELLGLTLRVTGVADPATRAAIRQFQQSQGLRADGIAGPETKDAILKARAEGVASPIPPAAPETPTASAPKQEMEASWQAGDGWSGEVEYERTAPIPAADYIKWVQRSLNRWYGLRLPVDGTVSGAYRAALRRFNQEWNGRTYSDVDERTQNDLIAANGRSGRYLRWVARALSKAGHGPVTPTDVPTGELVNAIKAFQRSVRRRAPGFRVDGHVGAKTELALIEATGLRPPGTPRRRAKRRPKRRPMIRPLTRREIKLFVWGITGERPTSRRLLREFADFVDLSSLLRKPSMTTLAKSFGKAYWKALSAEFKADPPNEFGALVGGAYALVDAAEGRRRTTLRPTSIARDARNGFETGYRKMRSHVKKLGGDPAAEKLLRRLKAAPDATAVNTVYRALLDVYRRKAATVRSISYIETRGNCSFEYPKAKVRRCGPLP